MGECEIKECKNEATITLARPVSKNHQIDEEGGLSWIYKEEAYVCDEHLELGQREYPFIVNKEP
ncbi:MAG TPA: hypothetical protein PKY82_03480 [Pyrinomonadaceae bacterium]|nr:hypothetical protein [Pyrinomonadaceae bacterium]